MYVFIYYMYILWGSIQRPSLKHKKVFFIVLIYHIKSNYKITLLVSCDKSSFSSRDKSKITITIIDKNVVWSRDENHLSERNNRYCRGNFVEWIFCQPKRLHSSVLWFQVTLRVCAGNYWQHRAKFSLSSSFPLCMES